jgi:hypothetical protein
VTVAVPPQYNFHATYNPLASEMLIQNNVKSHLLKFNIHQKLLLTNLYSNFLRNPHIQGI